jgi:hypothetical protein
MQILFISNFGLRSTMEGELPTTEYIVCFHWITDVKTGTALAGSWGRRLEGVVSNKVL